MTTQDRSTLDKTLAELLGFEDGVSDVVEHLLTIESSEVCGVPSRDHRDVCMWRCPLTDFLACACRICRIISRSC